MRKITKIERIKSKAVRIALTAFIANPKLGECQAVLLFAEIVAYLQKGMDDEKIVQSILQNHSTAPSGQLSL